MRSNKPIIKWVLNISQNFCLESLYSVNRSKFIYSNKTIDAKGIIQPLEDFLEKSKVSSFHINFISQNTSENLMNNNFFQRVGIQYHWKNNSFYLQRFFRHDEK